ncbi:hypothetical protein [Streptomyces griseoviridis]
MTFEDNSQVLAADALLREFGAAGGSGTKVGASCGRSRTRLPGWFS